MDYNKSFSLVMQLESLHTLLTVATIHNFNIMQFNLTLLYLHRTLKEELYMEQLDGHAITGKENWVWKLKKGLYRLVQAGRTWNDKLNSHMKSVGYAAMLKDLLCTLRVPGTRRILWPEDFGSMIVLG